MMQTKKTDYDLLVDLVLQFLLEPPVLNGAHQPTLYVQTNEGRQGFCQAYVEQEMYIFKILDGVDSLKAYCQSKQRQRQRQYQRFLDKEEIRQSQVMLKIGKVAQFYSHERTIHIDDEYACALVTRQKGCMQIPLYEESSFLFLIHALKKWLLFSQHFNDLKVEASSSSVLVYVLNEEGTSVKPKEIKFPKLMSHPFYHDLLVYQVQKLPQQQEIWEGMQYYLSPTYDKEIRGSRPYVLYSLINSRKTNRQLFSSSNEIVQQLLSEFLNQIKVLGYRPGKLVVDDEVMYCQFYHVCHQINVTCEIGKIETLGRKMQTSNQAALNFNHFYSDTKQYCQLVLERAQDRVDERQSKRFSQQITMFRFQMLVYSSQRESQWTPETFNLVYEELLSRMNDVESRQSLAQDLYLYFEELSQCVCIPYATVFMQQLTEQLVAKQTI